MTKNYESPVGTLIIKASAGFITEIKFAMEEQTPLGSDNTEKNRQSVGTFGEGEGTFTPFAPEAEECDEHAVLQQCARELDAYFAGELRRFTVPICAKGTPFRERVWGELCKIPYGEKISYKELAVRAGNPAAVRAVGGANHHNPVNIIIPCHRVIGANGSLTGYGGGLERKKFLLELEHGAPIAH